MKLVLLILIFVILASGASECVEYNEAGIYIGTGKTLSSGTYTTKITGTTLAFTYPTGSLKLTGIKSIPCNNVPPITLPYITAIFSNGQINFSCSNMPSSIICAPAILKFPTQWPMYPNDTLFLNYGLTGSAPLAVWPMNNNASK